MATFTEIQDAFEFVSSDAYGMNSAVFIRGSGQILYRSEAAGIDETEDMEEELAPEECVQIPHRDDLGLGKALVFQFVERYLPKSMTGYTRSSEDKERTRDTGCC
jgi:hypothetical protein